MKFAWNTLGGLMMVWVFGCFLNAQQVGSSQVLPLVPRLVNFSGRATDDQGKPISGVAGVAFAIYKDQNDGSPLWMETQNVHPDAKGNYSAQLGAGKAEGLPLELFASGEARWLGVRINGGDEQPRVLLLSVPYALKAADAETVGGLPPSAFVLAAPPVATPASAVTETDETVQPSAPGTTPVTTAGGTVNKLAKFDAKADITNSLIFDNGTNVGIGNTAPGAKLDVTGTSIFRGALTLPAIAAATATAGKNSQSLNFAASAFNSGTATAVSQTFRWQAEPVGNDTTSPLGKLNLLFGSGTAAPKETGFSISNKGIITFATGQAFPGGGGSGTVTSVALSAPASDFTVSGSPVTGSGTLGLKWKVVPTSANAANAMVKRDASGGFSAGALTVKPTGVAIGTTVPSKHLDLGNDGSVVISSDPGDDTTADLVAYSLSERGPGGVANGWSIYTAAIGGGFGVPKNSFSVFQYPPNADPGFDLNRFSILPSQHGDSVSTVVISGEGFLSVGANPHINAPLVATALSANDYAAYFDGLVGTGNDLNVVGCVFASGNNIGGTCLSDARLKDHVQPYPSVLGKLVQLRPVTYTFRAKEFPQFHLGSSRTSGLIAQEVEKVFPEMVVEDRSGFKRVNYGQLPCLMLQAIRELKAENDRLRDQVKSEEERSLAARDRDREDERAELSQLRAEVERLAAIVRTNNGAPAQASASRTNK